MPIKLIPWGLKTAKKYDPDQKLAKLDEAAIDQLLLSFSDTASKGMPFYIEVDEGENGDKVEIYIG